MASRRQRFKPPDIIDFKWRDRQTEETIRDMFADSIERIRLEDAASLPRTSAAVKSDRSITVEPIGHSTIERTSGSTVIPELSDAIDSDAGNGGRAAQSSTVIHGTHTTVVEAPSTTDGQGLPAAVEPTLGTTVVWSPNTTVDPRQQTADNTLVSSPDTTVERSREFPPEVAPHTTVVLKSSCTVEHGVRPLENAPVAPSSSALHSSPSTTVELGSHPVGDTAVVLRGKALDTSYRSTVEPASNTMTGSPSASAAEPNQHPAADTPTVLRNSTAERIDPSFAEPTSDTTVVPEADSTVELDDTPPLPASMIWVSESGDFIPPSRIRQLRNNKVQLALNPQELKMFQYLWGFPREWGGEEYRERQVGYTELIRQLDLSKRSVRLIVHRLIEKFFVTLQSPPTYERQAAVYRVYCYQSVYKALERAGKLYYAHSGQGTVFVKPYSNASRPVHAQAAGTTVELRLATTVDRAPSTTVQPSTASPVESEGSTTVEARACSTVASGQSATVDLRPHLRESLRESAPGGSPSSSEIVEAVVTAVLNTLTIDDGLARTALSKLQEPLKIHQAVYFARLAATKVVTQKNALNPQGLWVAQFVNYASGTTMKLYEDQVRLEREQYRSLGMTEETWMAVLANPAVPADQKELARRILDI